MRDRKELLDATVAAFNQQDYAAIAEFYADGAELEVPGQQKAQGKEAVIALWKTQYAAFPGAQLTVTRFIDAGDAAIVELLFEGVNRGPLAMPDGTSVPPTGKSVRLRSASVADLDGDLITHHRGYGDNIELMAQLGLLPAPATA